VKTEDLKIELYPTISPGGQHVGVVRAGVKVTHIPTGLIAIADCERSQVKNKNVAMGMIEYGLALIDYDHSASN
jgi:protein subunit release factor A